MYNFSTNEEVYNEDINICNNIVACSDTAFILGGFYSGSYKGSSGIPLRRCRISNNKITDEMIAESGFGEITSKNRTLNSVIIQNNNITSEGIKSLFEEKINNCVIVCDDIKDIDSYYLQWIKLNSKPKKKKTNKKKNKIIA